MAAGRDRLIPIHREAGEPDERGLEDRVRGQATELGGGRRARLNFFHAAPWTPHVLVGAGRGPSAILMVGGRFSGKRIVYPLSEAAARYGATVERRPLASGGIRRLEAPRAWDPPQGVRCAKTPAPPRRT